MEDDTGAVDGVNDGGETGFGQNDICGTAGSVGGTLNDDTDIGTRQGGPWFTSFSSASASLPSLSSSLPPTGMDSG